MGYVYDIILVLILIYIEKKYFFKKPDININSYVYSTLSINLTNQH